MTSHIPPKNCPDAPHTRGCLLLHRLGIDTHQEPVLYLREDSAVARSEGFESMNRVEVTTAKKHIVATLNLVRGDLLGQHQAGLSEAAWRLLDAHEGEPARFAHPAPLDSLKYVRAKVFGRVLEQADFEAIINDVVAGHYADVHLAAFIAACGGNRLSATEMAGLTHAMVQAGQRLHWPGAVVADKHCVGGIPGNRTTPIVVALLTCHGLLMPKTSSRAITSASGTADTMETLTRVSLSMDEMRRVVEQEGGCLAWGAAASLSPADDILIRVERALDLDSEGQLVASVLSKKIAAGSTHVLLDIPVGPTAKVRSEDNARLLEENLSIVASHFGLKLKVVLTDGNAPVGSGIGPALEARDVLAVLTGHPQANAELRRRALFLSGQLLEMCGKAKEGQGEAMASKTLESGAGWEKFQAICRAQGGLFEPPIAPLRHDIKSAGSGVITAMDNRKLAKVARLAGAPEAKAAGVELHVGLGQQVQKGDILFTLHAETEGEMEYALQFLTDHNSLMAIE